MIGRTVGHYRILERLGGGGMGVVYKAEDTKLGRMVALKFLPSELTRDDDAKQRFLIEARAAAKLEHPNVCPVYEIAESDDGHAFIAMAYYGGESLAARIARGPFTVEEATRIAIEIAHGLAAAHAAGIIHRDIKPANIMLTDKGEVKIVDFGVAKLADVTMTRSRASAGTLAYMAPEQIRSEPVTPATDLWALGVVLFEMLTGARPFHGDYEQAAAYAILNEPMAPLDQLLPDRPPGLDSALAKALTKDPAGRWQTAEEFIDGLEAVSANQAAVRHDRRSNLRPMSLLTAVLAILVVVGAWIWKQRGAGVSTPAVDSTQAGATTTAGTLNGLDPKQVAVTAFANRTGDASLDPVGRIASDWITDELMRIDIHALTRQQLEEVAATLAKDPSATSTDPELALAKATGSGLLVTGEYFASAPTLTIRMKVIDTATREVLSVLDPVEGPRSNPSDVVAMAGRLVRDALAVRLIGRIPGETILQQSHPPAYEAYAELVLCWEAASVPDYRNAIVHAKRAVEIDPDFAEAWLALAGLHYDIGEMREANDALARAEALRSELSPVGRLQLDGRAAFLSGRFETAIASYRAFERRMPLDSEATWQLLNFLLATGRAAETLEVAARKEIQIQLVPDAPMGLVHWYRTVSSAHAVLGDHERELEVARGLRAILPADFHGHVMEARALAALGRFDELNQLIEESLAQRGELPRARWVILESRNVLRAHGYRKESLEMSERAIATVHALAPDQQAKFQGMLADHSYRTGQWDEAERILTALSKDPANEKAEWRYLAQLGVIAAARGDRTRALEISETLKAVRDAGRPGATTFHRSRIAAQLGDRKDAVDLLKQAFSEGWTAWPSFFQLSLAEDPAFESLRGYSPFEELMKPKG